MVEKPTYEQLQKRVQELERQIAQKATSTEQPDLYERILDGIINGVWLTDPEDKIAYTNRAMEIIAGIPRDEIMGTDVIKGFPESTLQHLRPHYIKAKESLEPVYYDGISVVTPAGRESYQSGWLIPRVENNRFVGMICTVEDVTKQKEAEAELRDAHAELENRIEQRTADLMQANALLQQEIVERKAAEEALRREYDRAQSYLDTAEAIIVALDREGRITLINQKGCRVFGSSSQEMIGRHWFSACLPQPDGMERVYPSFLKLIAGEIDAAEYFENPIISSNSELRQIAWHNSLIRDDQGRVMGTLSFGEDITERKEAERALRESEERYRAIFEQAANSIVLVDLNTYRFAEFNDKACDNLGYTRQEFENLKLLDVESEQSSEMIDQHVAELLGKETIVFETKHKRKDGAIRNILVTSRVVTVSENNYALSIWYDITDRKKMEQALEETSTRLQTALQASNVGIWDWDLYTNRIHFSPEWKAQIGFGPDELEGVYEEWEGRIHPEDLGPTLAVLHDYLGGRSDEYKHEFRFRHKDGSYRWIYAEGQLLADQAGQPYRMLGCHVDITDRKQTEKALRESEKKFRTLIENVIDWVWEVDADGHYTYVSPQMESIMGYRSFEVLGKVPFDFMPPHEAERVRPIFSEAVAKRGRIEGLEDILLTKNGREVIFETNATPLFDDWGEFTGYMGTCRDITARKHAGEALKASEERFDLAMKFSNEGLFDWNLQTNAIYYSPGWKKMLGYEDHEIENEFSEWERLTREEDVKATLEMMKEVIERSRERFEIELQMLHKKGHWVDILSRANVLRDENGEAVRVVGTHVDISGLKKMEAQLRQAQRMEAIGTLAGGVAHDFNNILSPILVQTELVKLTLSPDHPVQENLEEILKAGHRAKDLVKHILAFSRQESQKLVSLDIGTTVKEVIKLIRATIPSSIEVIQQIPDAPAPIVGNPARIHELIMNLCTNASQAMDEMGSVLQVQLAEVELDQGTAENLSSNLAPGEYLRLTVSDTGHGIPSEIIGKIFDPYFTTKDVGEGTGMGLAVAHGVVTEHGGAITVYSEPGQGTTFHVFFPKAQGEPVQEATADKISLTGTERILFVDDEEPIVRSGSRMLEQLGYRVRSTTNSVEALEIFLEHPDDFDLVVTDMTMPTMTGDVLAREILNIRPDMPVILCTGFSHRIDEAKAKAMGIKGWIMKPFVLREAAELVRSVLDANRQRR